MIIYVFLIVMAIILHNVWPLVAGIILYLIANWPSESAYDRALRRTRKMNRKGRLK